MDSKGEDEQVLCQKSGCRVISKRQQVETYDYEAEQGVRTDPNQNAWIMLVAAIAIAIRMCLVRRAARERKAAAKLKNSFTRQDDPSDDGYSSGYSSSGGFSRENSAHSFSDLLLASQECSDEEDTATTVSSFTDSVGLSSSRLLYVSTRRRVNNVSYSDEPGRGTASHSEERGTGTAGGARTSPSYPTLLPASQKTGKAGERKFLLCAKDLREDLEKKTTRGQLVNGKREPPGFRPQW
mmetsp:Transcript_4836/g.10837  ORF Transcript_4836/g.10837 Transcript_4836/m.10837 type:complete len:239 (+) Transcript_4836:273-989(+)